MKPSEAVQPTANAPKSKKAKLESRKRPLFPWPVHSRDEVVASFQATFPKSSWARVLELLDSYGVEPYEQERERVQVAILKLSAGSEAKVREYVAVAKRDYRDVLFWAEYPEESKLDTREKRQRVRKMFEKFGIEPPSDL